MMKDYSVFTHLSTPNAADYRRVLNVFAQRRRSFIIHLRPMELSVELGIAEEEIVLLLDQLHHWGNLDRGKDYAEAKTIEVFYRVKWLYQLSERGEGAERALEVFDASLGQAGELQTGALRDIIRYLGAIAHQLEADDPDHGKLFQEMNHLNHRFDEFTTQAQRFMRSLQGSIELHSLSEADFLGYKEHLIEYLDRFVQDLVTSAGEIAALIRHVEGMGLRKRFPALARAARADALDPDDPEELEAEERRRSARWDGLRHWFLGDASGRSQAEMLRARTREAIPALLLAMQSFHDRRASGSDRRQDWLELARWFAQTSNEAQAHRLWRVAFCLTPSRHLRINHETLVRREEAAESARVSWLDAEPMWLEPQLRKSGRGPARGRAPDVIDLSRERELLRQLADEENRQIALAHEFLVHDGPLRLSAFGELDRAAFHLLLDLLGRLLTGISNAANHEPGTPLRSQSSDGSLDITLLPPLVPDEEATIETSEGWLTGPDYQVEIRPTASAANTTTEAAANAKTTGDTPNNHLAS